MLLDVTTIKTTKGVMLVRTVATVLKRDNSGNGDEIGKVQMVAMIKRRQYRL